MCGRTCLTLEPTQLIANCGYRPYVKNVSNGKEAIDEGAMKESGAVDQQELVYPEWRQINESLVYKPSHNIAPSEVTPVLVSGAHFDKSSNNGNDQRQCLVPMVWGMIPFWHKGDYRKHGLSTNNCRLEHMLESKMYSSPFRNGQRCVILCEGFYEWQTTVTTKPSERSAFYIHMPQRSSSIEIHDPSTWKSPADLKLLKMAGIYNVWKDQNGQTVYSYSIITYQSTKLISWLHHRMPAILETDQQVQDWLDYKRITADKAISLLGQSVSSLKWYRVSNLVNNSRQKMADCNKPIRLIHKEKMAKNPIMSAWLNARKRKEAQLAKIITNDDDDGDEMENDVIDNYRRFSIKPSFKRTSEHTKAASEGTAKRPCRNNNR